MLFIDSPRVSNQIDVVNRFLLSRAHLKSGSKVLVDQLKVFGKPTKTEERLWTTRAIVLWSPSFPKLPIGANWNYLTLPLSMGGEVTSSKPTMFNELAKLASVVAEGTSEFLAKVTGVETFGEDERVSVLVLEKTDELLRLRKTFEKWDDSDFSVYKPHATIGPEGTVINPVPLYLVFDRLAVVWGDQILSFKLKTYG